MELLRDEEVAARILADQRRELSFGAALAALLLKKWTILIAIAAASLFAIAVVLVIPPQFSAEAVILPPQAPQSSASMVLGQLSGLSALGAMSGLSGAGLSMRGTDVYLYIGILRSRTIADDLIARFRLQQTYHLKTVMDTRKMLARHTTITTSRDPLIHIKVEERDPKLAADLANAYVEELFKQNSVLALTEASQRRLFFEQQYSKEKDALAEAEVAMRNTQMSTRMVSPTGQAEVVLRVGAQLRASIVEHQAELGAMKTFAADSNPQYQRLKEELSALQSEYQRLENGSRGSGSMDLSARELPQASLEYLRKLRDLKYHEALFEMVAKQYEAARLDEAKAAPVVQVVDHAVVPEKKSWPPRTMITFAAAMLAAIASCCWVLLKAQPESRSFR